LDEDRRAPHDSVALIVAWQKGAKGYNFGRVRVSNSFTRQLRAFADEAERRILQRRRRDYAIGDSFEDDEFMTSPIDQAVPEPIAQDSAERPRRMRAPSAEDPAEFRKAMVSIGRMDQVGAAFLRRAPTKFYAIVRGRNIADRVVYVRNLNPMKLAKSGNIVLTLGDTLDRLEEVPFVMDDSIDVIIRPERIDILTKSFFDNLFFGLSGKGDDLDTIVEATLAVLPFADETLERLVALSRTKKRNRRKILEIYHSGHLREVTIVRFKSAVIADGHDPSDFVLVDEQGNESITSSEENVDELLRILNEDLYEGGLSGRRLEASSKRVRPAVG
jgi:hypothetical protein